MIKIRSVLVFGAAILVVIAICVAQQPAAKFVELQRREIPGAGLEGVTTVAEIPPGMTSARHSHPGEDFGYLIEGTIVLMVDGKPPVTVHAGEVFFTERGQIHNARNIGTTMARAVDTYVIDKGKPGITPAH
jgi:quercetin dioxygenase-like cupin family protein